MVTGNGLTQAGRFARSANEVRINGAYRTT
jgi:hypothetical protein